MKKQKTKIQKTDAPSTAETNARKQIFEEIFYDLGTSKARVLWFNFFRGIFFGFGSVLGATVVVAIVAYILGFFIDLSGLRETVDYINNSIDTPN